MSYSILSRVPGRRAGVLAGLVYYVSTLDARTIGKEVKKLQEWLLDEHAAVSGLTCPGAGGLADDTCNRT
jgi:hypothetical protein